MVDLFRETTPRARKEHKCYLCGQEIEKGNRYTRWEYLMDGEFRSDAYHMKCTEVISYFCEREKVQEFNPSEVLEWAIDGEMEMGP